MHQADRHWSIAEGNEPTEADREGQRQTQRPGKEKGKEKRQDKPKEGTSDKSSMKCLFCKEKGHARKDCPKFLAWLAEKRMVGHEQSANAIEEDGWIFALDHEHEERK